MKKATVLSAAMSRRVLQKRPVGARRIPVQPRKDASLVDEMLGIAELRLPVPGTDPHYDTLQARLVTHR
jgi:hypothetical protein